MSSSEMPDPYAEGVIAWRGRMLVYWREAGQWCARLLGEPGVLDMEPALRAAIEADRLHQRRKARGADGEAG